MKNRMMLFLGLLCLMIELIPAIVFATGTPAGTEIKNVAKATYKDVGGNPLPEVTSDTAKTIVDQKAGIDLTPISYYRIVGDSVNVDMKFRLTNMGNGTDNFDLENAVKQSGWTHVFYLDADSNGTPDNFTPVTDVSNLAADGKYYFTMRTFVPDQTANNTSDTILVTATSVWGKTHDPAAVAYSHDTIMVKRVDFTGTKTTLQTSPKPQDVVTYNITFLNNGSSNAKSVTLTDVLPSYLNSPGSVVKDSGDGTPAFGGNTLTWNAGSVLPGRGIGLHFSATVNSNLPAGTSITNSVGVTYVDSISNRNKRDTTYITIFISDSLGWILKVDVPGGGFATNNSIDSVNVSEKETFVLKLTNRGNRTDTASIVKTTSIPLSWTIYADINKNGSIDGGDTLCSVFASTGPVGQNVSLWYVVTDTPANSLADRIQDSSSYKFTSVTATSNFVDGYTKTIVKKAVLTLKKFVEKISVGNLARPGDTLMYYVRFTNTGSGSATVIALSDIFPSQVTFISGTIETSPDSSTWTSRTDAASWSEGSITKSLSIGSGTLTYNISNVGPGAFYIPDNTWKGYVRFKVRIN